MIVAGFGFRGSATEESLRDALAATGIDPWPKRFATLDTKAENDAFRAFAAAADAEVFEVDADALQTQQTLTQSPASQGTYGSGSVAEAAALAAAGPGSKLLAPRAISSDSKATCAIATGDTT